MRVCDITQVCRHYNRSGVPGGGCSLRDSCTNLHLCLHLVQDRCRFGPQCQRLHAVDGGGLKLLERWGLLAGDVVVRDLLVVYQNRHRLLAAAAPQASWEANAAQGERAGERSKGAGGEGVSTPAVEVSGGGHFLWVGV